MVAYSVIEFRTDPDAEFTRLYLLLLKAAFENRQSSESHDDNSRERHQKRPPTEAALFADLSKIEHRQLPKWSMPN